MALNFSKNTFYSKLGILLGYNFQITEMAEERQFVLLVVRHGQGTHNLGEDDPGFKYFVAFVLSVQSQVDGSWLLKFIQVVR